MRRWYLIILLGWFLVGCGGDSLETMPPGPESSEEIDDYCEVFGWYDDGHCDDVCPEPDPDCEAGPGPSDPPDPGPGPGPEPTDPEECPGEDVGWAREYVEFGSCELVDLDCESWGGNWVAFEDDCGCGCEEAQNTGPVEEPEPAEPLPEPTTACLDDSNPDVDRVGDLDECRLIDFDCGEAYVPFYDDCGCGCRLSCSDDFECPNGYCGADEACGDAEGDLCQLFCQYPECGDGSELTCRQSRPDCYDSDVAAIINGCWECLDARTCGPSQGP